MTDYLFEIVCASYVFGSAALTYIDTNKEPLTELNGPVDILEIKHELECKPTRSQCILPTLDIVERIITPKTIIPQIISFPNNTNANEVAVKYNIDTNEFNSYISSKHFIVTRYKIDKGRTWMSNTHIGPSRQRVLFHSVFRRRWPLTLTVAAAGVGFFMFQESPAKRRYW